MNCQYKCAVARNSTRCYCEDGFEVKEDGRGCKGMCNVQLYLDFFSAHVVNRNLIIYLSAYCVLLSVHRKFHFLKFIIYPTPQHNFIILYEFLVIF